MAPSCLRCNDASNTYHGPRNGAETGEHPRVARLVAYTRLCTHVLTRAPIGPSATTHRTDSRNQLSSVGVTYIQQLVNIFIAAESTW